MKKGIQTIVAAALGATMLFSASCGGKGESSSSPTGITDGYEYTPQHYSMHGRLAFYSDDTRLDNFLNEYFERHMRYSDLRVHEFPVGGGQPVWKEWESIIASFWDASVRNLGSYSTNVFLENWLRLKYMSRQDRQGYISTSTGVSSDDWGQGWAFPEYKHNRLGGYGAEFASESETENWIAGTDTTVGYNTVSSEGYMTLSAKSAESISAETEIVNRKGGKGVDAFCSPFLHFSWKANLQNGTEANVEDLYVYFRTGEDDAWSEDKCMRYSEYASVTADFSSANGVSQGTFLPMFLNEKWGRDPIGNKKITALKFVLKAKEGTRLDGEVSFNFIRCDFDDRFGDNCGQYIAAAKNYLGYKQDTELLKEVLPVARGAMQFYLTCLDGAANGVIDNSYLVGHFNAGAEKNGAGISDGFWDAISFPNVNLYSNLSYHQALKGMIYLEEMAEAAGVTVPETKVLGKDMKTEIVYSETVSTLREKLARCEEKMRELFWDNEKGRFYAGNYDSADGTPATGGKMDYGFVLFNLQAVTDGVATEEQAEKIMEWISGERIVEGDDSTGSDLYKFRFAPRFSTKNNTTDNIWVVGQSKTWENGVRNGGAVMQTSYYDLISRTELLGGNDAFSRLKEIEAFYYDVRAFVTEDSSPRDFYRNYFNSLGIGMQGAYDGQDHEGPIGIDCEFYEAAILFASVPDAFFGLSPSPEGNLTVSPSFPDSLKFWRMENLYFAGSLYDLSVGKYFVQITNMKEETNRSVTVKLSKPSASFRVYYNGTEIPYTEEDGRIVVTIPFANGKVELK